MKKFVKSSCDKLHGYLTYNYFCQNVNYGWKNSEELSMNNMTLEDSVDFSMGYPVW